MWRIASGVALVVLALAWPQLVGDAARQVDPTRAGGAPDSTPVFFSTFLGEDDSGNALDRSGVAVDRQGHIIVVGATRSGRVPVTAGALKSARTGATDLFVVRLDPTLKTLVAATLLGGAGDESSPTVALDPQGNIYVSGDTTSTDFPAGAAMLAGDAEPGPRRTFIVRLSNDLSKMLSSAVLSVETAPRTGASVLTFDERRQRLLVGGATTSPRFPTTPGAFQAANASGLMKKYVAILDPSLTKVVAATLVGGDDAPEGAINGLVTDRTGHVFVGGSTFSRTYPTTPRAFKRAVGADGVYGAISKLSPDLTTLVASTYVGETGRDFIYGLTLDLRENVVFAGHLADPMPTTPRAYLRTNRGNPDVANVGVLSNDLSTLVASTFVCGGGEGSSYGGFSYFGPVLVDRTGAVFVRGLTRVPYFPTTPGAYQDSLRGGRDVVLVKLTADLSSLTASSFLGGSGDDLGGAMALDPAGAVVVVGGTLSKDFPVTEGSHQATLNGRQAYFVTRIGAALADPERLPAHQAARSGDLVRLRSLMDRDPSAVRQVDRSQRVPIHWAARFGRVEALRWLAGAGADVNAQDEAGRTPLHLAALRGQTAAVEALAEARADLDRADRAGDSALHLAALAGQDEVVRTLLGRKANANVRNARGLTPLHRAAFSRHRDATRALLDGGADSNVADQAGNTPLHLAVTVLQNEATVALLLERGARREAVNARKQTPLHLAAGYSWEANALGLLASGPDVGVKDDQGRTPLHIAVDAGSMAIVKALLDKGADPSAADVKGQSPLDLAKAGKDAAMIALVERAAAARRRLP